MEEYRQHGSGEAAPIPGSVPRPRWARLIGEMTITRMPIQLGAGISLFGENGLVQDIDAVK